MMKKSHSSICNKYTMLLLALTFITSVNFFWDSRFFTLPNNNINYDNLVPTTTTRQTETLNTTTTTSPNNDTTINNFQSSTPASQLCHNKRGILLIQRGDPNAAVGTLFFLYIVNHLIYAEEHNLIPWVHLDPVFPCYDASVHGDSSEKNISSWPAGWLEESKIRSNDKMRCFRKAYYPGPPVKETTSLPNKTLTLIGNGIWLSYFQPLTSIAPDDCQHLPLLSLKERSTYPGFHTCSPSSVRPWQVRGLPLALRAKSGRLQQWFAPMRQRGAQMVSKYFQLLPWLEERVQQANPASSNEEEDDHTKKYYKCLSMHIRLTDKADGRNKPPLSLFQSYAEAYAGSVQSSAHTIFIATDDGTILSRIQREWNVSSLKLSTQPNVIRSSGNSSIFDTFQNQTHRTNAEGLVDIYALSRCDFFIHGYSAMAEAAIYLHPALHNQSVNVDYPQDKRIPVTTFQQMVTEFYTTTNE